MLVKNFNSFYKDNVNFLHDIVNSINSLDKKKKKWCKHLNRKGSAIQYFYYCALVKQYLNEKNSQILDWGSQYGHVSKILLKYYDNVISYNPLSEEETDSIFNIESNLNEIMDLLKLDKKYRKFGIKPTSKLPFDDCSFDAIISSGVLEHVREDYEKNDELTCLIEINRCLKVGGRLFIWNLPNKYGSIEILNRLLRRSVHNFTYEVSHIQRLLSDSNFEIEILDKHEFLNLQLRELVSKFSNSNIAWQFDYYLSKLPIFNFFHQHYTIIARKLND